MTVNRVKIILVYGLVVVLSTFAFVALGYLYDTPLTGLYLESGSDVAFQESAITYGINKERISRFTTVHIAAPYAGALFGLILSFISFRRKKLDKRLLLPVAVVAVLISLVQLTEIAGIRAVFFAPGQLVSGTVTVIYTINYLIWLGLSFWLAFSKWLIPAQAESRQV